MNTDVNLLISAHHEDRIATRFVGVILPVFTVHCNAACYIKFVHLSITCRYCVKMNEHRMMQSSLEASTVCLVFGNVTFINIVARGHPY